MIPLFITGAGAITSVGLDAARTIASLRAGHEGLTEIPFAGKQGKDLRAAPVRGYAEGILGEARFVEFAAKALGECLATLRREEPDHPVVFLGLPDPSSPSGRAGLDAYVAGELRRRFGLPDGSVRTISQGATSAFTALPEAARLLQTGPRACIVGAVDTLTAPQTLKRLSADGQLSEIYDGFFPGEAAAFVCVNRRSNVGAWGRRAASILGVGEAIETADGTADAPLVGVGMVAAMRAALTDAQTTEAAVGMCINAVNGARVSFEDEAYAHARLLRSPREHLTLWHIASYLGETGAAFGALALLLAAGGLELGFAPQPGILLSTPSGARRAAVFVQSTEPGRQIDPAGPAVGIGEACFHATTPISSTSDVVDDPGFRLGAADDTHRRLAENDFDRLASLLAVRMHHLGSDAPWADIVDYERRINAHLDALGWSGAPAHELALRGLEGEPEEAAAGSMVLACATARGGELDALLAACAASQEHCDAIIDHLAISPRKLAEQFFDRLLVHEDPALRVAALRGLTIAGALTPARLAKLGQAPHGEEAEALVLALGTLRAVGQAQWALGWWRTRSDAPPTLATLATLALQDGSAPVSELSASQRHLLVPEALGLASLRVGNSLVAELQGVMTRGAMIALGWNGEIAGVPLLLAGLGADEDVAREAGHSLSRMFGVFPVEAVDVDDELDDEIVDQGAAGAAPVQREDRPSLDPDQWGALLLPLRDSFAPRDRIRGGRPWTKRSAMAWLLAPSTPCSERAVAAWEHAIVNGATLPVDPRQWIVAQRRQLQAS